MLQCQDWLRPLGKADPHATFHRGGACGAAPPAWGKLILCVPRMVPRELIYAAQCFPDAIDGVEMGDMDDARTR